MALPRRPGFPAHHSRAYPGWAPEGRSSQFLYTRRRLLSAALTIPRPAARSREHEPVNPCASGSSRLGATSSSPVFPAHDREFWDKDDWSHWRGSVWKSRPERRYTRAKQIKVYRGTVGCAPAGTRPRDLRSSYITLRVYEGVPLTTIAREVGTSITMIEKHYAGIIENWDGKQIPAERQIRRARAAVARSMRVGPVTSDLRPLKESPANRAKPAGGLEPPTRHYK